MFELLSRTVVAEIDRLCDAFEQAWIEGYRPDIGEYCERVEEEYRNETFSRLLELDHDYRTKTNTECSAEFYLKEFPAFKQGIDQFFETHIAGDTTPHVQFTHMEALMNAVQQKILSPELAEKLIRLTKPGDSILETARSTIRVPTGTLTNLESLFYETNDLVDDAQDHCTDVKVDQSEIVDAQRENFTGLPLRYQINAIIGRGASSLILDAYDRTMERRVAIKVLTHVSATMARLVATERSILSRLDHPSIVKVFDSSCLEDGRPYIVMEYVHGNMLSDAAANLDFEDKLRVMHSCAEAVGFAHQCGIVHRDLKPENILLSKDGSIKLLDFGFAQPIVQNDSDYFAGTVAYAAPEQMEQSVSDERSDIYALGVIFYELLFGRLPEGFAQKVGNIGDSVRAKREFSMDWYPSRVPAALRAIVRKSLKADSNKRYANGRDLSNDLNNYLMKKPVMALGGTPSVYWLEVLFCPPSDLLAVTTLVTGVLLASLLVAIPIGLILPVVGIFAGAAGSMTICRLAQDPMRQLRWKFVLYAVAMVMLIETIVVLNAFIVSR